MVVGGSRRSPGAVLLAGEAALRVGAGRLGLVVPESIEARLGVMLPEAAVFPLPAHASDRIEGPVRDELESADAVLVGPGFDDAEETRATLLAIAEAKIGCLILDAFALGILPDVPRSSLPDVLILNPNQEEAAILLGRDLAEDDRAAEMVAIAERFDAVVNCYGLVATPDGATWQVTAGGAGSGHFRQRRRARGRDQRIRGSRVGAAARGGLGELGACPCGRPAHRARGHRLPRA